MPVAAHVRRPLLPGAFSKRDPVRANDDDIDLPGVCVKNNQVGRIAVLFLDSNLYLGGPPGRAPPQSRLFENAPDMLSASIRQRQRVERGGTPEQARVHRSMRCVLQRSRVNQLAPFSARR
jgi:hypothetical protein